MAEAKEPNASFEINGICSAEDGCIELFGSPQPVTFHGNVTGGTIELVCSRCNYGAVSGKGPETEEEEKPVTRTTTSSSSKS